MARSRYHYETAAKNPSDLAGELQKLEDRIEQSERKIKELETEVKRLKSHKADRF